MTSDFLELVRSRRLELGLSYQSLAAACIDPASSTKASSGWLYRLETGSPVIPPSMELLGALAAGLQLPRVRLQEAAAAQFFDVRVPWEMSGEAAEVLANLVAIPEGQRRAALELIRVMAGGR